MSVFYRFQNDVPKVGEIVHCYKNKQEFLNFVRMMKTQDPHFYLMKFWEITGQFIRPDDDDVVVKVLSAKQISI